MCEEMVMKKIRLPKDENIAKGYAVITPTGIYVKPISNKLIGYVDSGHIKIDEWGNPYTTDQFDKDIKALTKPEPQPLSTGFDKMLEALEIDEINTLSEKIKTNYPQSSFHWLLEGKPAELEALENQLQRKLDAFWTPERKAITAANKKALDDYETAVIRIENLRSDLEMTFTQQASYKANAVARKNDPVLAATQDKISAIITDKKRSSEKKVLAVAAGVKSANASFNAKREIVLAIASGLGKGLDKDSIYANISQMVEFTALAYKRPEKEFNRLYKDTVAWIHHKNQIKVFWDLMGVVSEGSNNKKLQQGNRTQLPGILTLVALLQAKDNDSRGLVAFNFMPKLITRSTVVMYNLLEVDRFSIANRFKAYDKAGYLNYEKGVQGGVASRAGITPFLGELTQEQINTARATILDACQGAVFFNELKAVLDLINSKPDYNDQALENAVEALLEVFVPLATTTGEVARNERAVLTEAWNVIKTEEKLAHEKEQAEITEKVTAHIASGKGFQPRRRYLQPAQINAEASEQLIDSKRFPTQIGNK